MEHPELTTLRKQLEAKEVNMKSHSSMKSYLSALSATKREIKRIGDSAVRKYKKQQLDEIQSQINELQHRIKDYTSQTEMSRQSNTVFNSF